MNRPRRLTSQLIKHSDSESRLRSGSRKLNEPLRRVLVENNHPRRRTVPTKKVAQSVSSPKNVKPSTVDQPSSEPRDNLVGRHTERSRVKDFVRTCIDSRQSGSLYISGSPGSGKTAVVLCEVERLKRSQKCRCCVVNCMQLSSAMEVYSRIGQELVNSSENGKYTNDVATNVEALLNRTPKGKTVVLILDEVDQLSRRYQDVLYR